MGNIHYDPEKILNGFTVDSLKDLAKRLKRRIRMLKSDIIQDILSPPSGKTEDWVKVWQEINRTLRKELESFNSEELKIFSLSDTPLDEQFKVSYMFTLSSDSEIKTIGEELYCQAEGNQVLDKTEKEREVDNEIMKAENSVVRDNVDELNQGDESDEEASAVFARMTAEVETRKIHETPTGELIELTVTREPKESKKPQEPMNIVSIAKAPISEQETEETKELHKRIKTLEKKLKKTNSEGIRTKNQLEKLKSDWVGLKAQWLREKEEAGKYRNRVKELEAEGIEKDKELEMLKNKLKQLQQDSLARVKVERSGEIDLAAYKGRKALIFAERDQKVEIKLNALGIIPIWAMEIDWNRPRRRMSTCQIILYKINQEKHKKLNEIREIASHLNIPCSELMTVK